jgi:hypothetical protein
MDTARVRRSGSLQLPAPPRQVLYYFTPEGEREYEAVWAPEYFEPGTPAPNPGLAFRTRAGGEETLWLVLEYDETGGRASYARVVPGVRLGVVTVRCEAEGGGTRVHVAYDQTAVSEAGRRALAAFTQEAFDAMLREWRRAICRVAGWHPEGG